MKHIIFNVPIDCFEKLKLFLELKDCKVLFDKDLNIFLDKNLNISNILEDHKIVICSIDVELLRKIFNKNYKKINIINYDGLYTNEFSILNQESCHFIKNLILEFSILCKLKLYSMLSDEEKYNLYYISKNLKCKSDSCIIEYGVFLGGSLEPIIYGLEKNSCKNNINIYGVDFFKILRNNEFFYKDFLNRFKTLGISYKEEKDYIDWFDYVNYNLPYKNLKLIRKSACEFIPNQYISLMHIDLAKNFNILKCILKNTNNFLNENSIIIFQDFFLYQSGESIAFLMKLIKEKKIDIYFKSNYSSLYFKFINLDEKDYLSFNINDVEYLVFLIEEGLKFFNLNFFQKASLYGAIMFLYKKHRNYLKFNLYKQKLLNIQKKHIATFDHINRILKDIEILKDEI